MNIATRSSDQVYVEPMEIMAEPTLFTRESFVTAQQKQLQKSREGIAAFIKTGKLPEGKSLISLIDQERADLAGLSLEDLTPAARALALKRRQYLAEIEHVMRLGLPLKDSIGMLNLVESHFATQAFTTKDGVPKMVAPSASRYGIRSPAVHLRRSDLYSEGGHKLIPIKTRAGKTEKATFMEFILDGDQFYTANENFSVYKSVLSGFDQDDDIITQLRTFKDESGKLRLGARIVRDPKSREEFLYAVPKFDSITTLQALLGKDPATITRLQSMMEDGSFLEQIMAETGIDESTAKNVFDKLKRVLAKRDGNFVYKTGTISDVDESSLFAIETIVRKAEEMRRGTAIESFQDAAEVVNFEAAVAAKSASPRGSNAIVRNNEGKLVTQKAARGLTTEQAGPYADSRMVQIATQVGTDPEIDQKTLNLFNAKLAELGYPAISRDQLIPFVSEDDYPGIPLSVRKAIAEGSLGGILDTTSASAIGDYAESIGSQANIAAGVESVSDILQDPTVFADLRDFITEEELVALQDSLGGIKVPVEPRSNVVDIINQSMGPKSLTPYDEAIRGLPVDEQKAYQIAYEAIAEQVRKRIALPVDYSNIHLATKYLQSDAIKAAASQQMQAVARLRAYQLAAGIDEKELVGFDPMVLSSRLKSVRAQLREAAIKAYKTALEDFSGDEKAQARITKELEKLQKSEEGLDIFALKRGSRRYKKYAAMSVQADMALEAEASIARQTGATKRLFGKSETTISAKAEYIKSAKEMIRVSGLSENFETIKELAEDPLKTSLLQDARRETGEKLAKGIRAIQSNYDSTSATTLDIVDALESELRTNFGGVAANLLGEFGEQGAEDVMMSLFSAAKKRRNARKAMKNPASFGVLQRAFREHTGDAEAAIDLVDQDYARSFLEYQSSLDDLSPERARSQHLIDFMQVMAAKSEEERHKLFEEFGKKGRAVAQEAFSFITGRNELKELGEEAASLVATAVEPGELEDIGSLADDIARSVTAGEDELFELARSGYKRMSFDVFKSKNVRTGAIAAAALIGASFLYQSKKKKDHTAADIQGPPLLPGGNPYETNYPTREAVINQIQQNNTSSPAMQYQVNTSGSMQDLNKLRGLFGDVVDGPINSTMYNGLPMLGQDPYSDVASRF